MSDWQQAWECPECKDRFMQDSATGSTCSKGHPRVPMKLMAVLYDREHPDGEWREGEWSELRPRQQFYVGDLVQMAEHRWDPSCRAVVVKANFNQMLWSYAIEREGSGFLAWLDQSELTFIEHGRGDLIPDWEEARRG